MGNGAWHQKKLVLQPVSSQFSRKMNKVVEWQAERSSIIIEITAESVRMNNIHEIRAAFDAIKLDDFLHVIIHLKKPRFFDSTGLGWLISIIRKNQAESIKIAVVAVDDALFRLFEIAQVDKVADLFDTLEEARSFFWEKSA